MSTVIKQEPNDPVKLEPSDGTLRGHVKHEPGTASDDDDYEDAGDLDMAQGKRGLWLIKLPKFLLEQWEKIDEDEEITLGQLFVSSEEKFRLQLNEKLPFHKELPTRYDMVLNNRHVTNTWVFTEKDMPGYGNEGPNPIRSAVQQDNMPSMPARLLYAADKKQSFADRSKGGSWKSSSGGVPNNKPPYMRKAIPKKTALVGTVVHEATVMSPENDERYKKLMLERQTTEPKRTIQLLEGPVGGNLLAPGTVGGTTGSFESFIKRDKEKEKKPADTKFTRMERSALLDALFGCFKGYTAWSIKGLKERLQQPEAYLKEVLGEIAVLHKSGKFALKYTLKPEYVQRVPEGFDAEALVKEEGVAVDAPVGVADEEEEEDEEMENVL